MRHARSRRLRADRGRLGHRSGRGRVRVVHEAAIRTGSVNPEEKIAEYLAKQKAAGVDKIIAEKQKQLDAFLAASKK